MNFLNVLQVLSLVTVLTGCGQAPSAEEIAKAGTTSVDPNPVTDPSDPVLTAPPATQPDPVNPSVTVLTFQYHNSTATCDAVHTWNPATTTIWFPANSGNVYWYVFRSDGVFMADKNKVITGQADIGGATETITREGAVGHPPLCYITVTDGQYISMHY